MRLNPWTIRAADSPIGLAHDALYLRAGAHDVLDLAQAAPQYPPAPEVVERIVATAQHPHRGEYTEIAGLPRLREAFAS
jgi:aspartate/methionine/tyrosine aminotransferase